MQVSGRTKRLPFSVHVLTTTLMVTRPQETNHPRHSSHKLHHVAQGSHVSNETDMSHPRQPTSLSAQSSTPMTSRVRHHVCSISHITPLTTPFLSDCITAYSTNCCILFYKSHCTTASSNISFTVACANFENVCPRTVGTRTLCAHTQMRTKSFHRMIKCC